MIYNIGSWARLSMFNELHCASTCFIVFNVLYPVSACFTPSHRVLTYFIVSQRRTSSVQMFSFCFTCYAIVTYLKRNFLADLFDVIRSYFSMLIPKFHQARIVPRGTINKLPKHFPAQTLLRNLTLRDCSTWNNL